MATEVISEVGTAIRSAYFRDAVGFLGISLRRVSRGTYLTENFRFSPLSYFPRAGYHYSEDVNMERKTGYFPGYSFLLILILLLLPRDSRDNVADLMKTSPPTELILDILGSIFLNYVPFHYGGTGRGAKRLY
ncbi:hypothetical protein PIB30_040433 [Stylosanthes scabra]|uniref:Uncharacterized protein n=1 Tax=Stylosanthes scabra TaxID=79078 RepID=A0ABU6TEU6_9FABA|nr:hypothetical protein [Stylosanthes scabra]